MSPWEPSSPELYDRVLCRRRHFDAVAREPVRCGPMPEIISREALAALWRDPRQAISEDAIVCLVCGGAFRHLTNTHLAHHGLTSESYKEIVGYNGRRSLMEHPVRRL